MNHWRPNPERGCNIILDGAGVRLCAQRVSTSRHTSSDTDDVCRTISRYLFPLRNAVGCIHRLNISDLANTRSSSRARERILRGSLPFRKGTNAVSFLR